jgi:hypothetical protein
VAEGKGQFLWSRSDLFLEFESRGVAYSSALKLCRIGTFQDSRVAALAFVLLASASDFPEVGATAEFNDESES